jgi:hypothetical protein
MVNLCSIIFFKSSDKQTFLLQRMSIQTGVSLEVSSDQLVQVQESDQM